MQNINSKKLLFVDPLSPEGHINFNKIYINALSNIFVSIDFAFKKGYEEKLSISKDDKVYLIPAKYYINSNNKISNRVRYIQIFRHIKKYCNINNYDFVIFSSYEEISLYLSFINRPLILINHNNISGLQDNIKLFFFKKLAKKNINIVFENYMKDYLLSLGINNVYTIHHGLPKSHDEKLLNNSKLIEDFSCINNFRYVIFSPSSTSTDINFLETLISNDVFNVFLRDNDILLILKNKHLNSNSKNIKIVKNYLTDLQYQYIFLRSHLIIIPYSDKFLYRVSGVLFESMANDKICLFSDIKALQIYIDFFNYDPIFNTVDDLINRISYIISNINKINNPYKNLFQLEPNFEFLFSNISIL